MNNYIKRGNNDIQANEERNLSSDNINERNKKSNENSEERNHNPQKNQEKGKMNYIQNYKNNFKYQGYLDIHKKTNNNGVVNINQVNLAQDSIQSHNTINHEESNSRELRTNHPNAINDKYFKDRFESHSPDKLIDVLQNLDNNIFVKIKKKDKDKKIDINNYQHRTSQFREKTKNSLTQLANILNNNPTQEIQEVNSNQGSNKISKVALRNQNSKASKESEPKVKSSTKPVNNGKVSEQQESQRSSQEGKQSSRNFENNKSDKIDQKLMSNTNPSLSHSHAKKSDNNDNINVNNNSNKFTHSEHNSFVENIYKRPKANKSSTKRDYSEDINEPTRNENKIKINQKIISDQRNLSEKDNFKDTKNQSMKDKQTLNKEALNEISGSTLLDNNNNAKMNHILSNQQVFYDESIKEQVSEENLHRKRFIDYIKSQDDKIQLKSMISVEMASKFSDEIVRCHKSEYQKEILELINKVSELSEQNKELSKENDYLKNQLKSASEDALSSNKTTNQEQAKYTLKLEKQNILLKNEYINNIKNKNTLIKKYNDELNEFVKMTDGLESNLHSIDNE